MSIAKKRLKKIAAIPESAIQYSGIAELGSDFWKNARVRLPEPKHAVALRIDSDVLRWFKARGKGYQSLMNAVLRSYYESMREKR